MPGRGSVLSLVCSSPEPGPTDTGHCPPPQGTPARPGLMIPTVCFLPRPRHYWHCKVHTGVSCGSSQPCQRPRATDRPTAAKHKYMPSPETAPGQKSLHEEVPKKIWNANFSHHQPWDPVFFSHLNVIFKQSPFQKFCDIETSCYTATDRWDQETKIFSEILLVSLSSVRLFK